MDITGKSSPQCNTWMALVEFEVCHPESPLDFSKPGGFSNVVGLASSETDFLDAITLTFKELRANILDIDDVEILDFRDHLDDVDPDILSSISLLSMNNKLELATIDYYLERLDQ